MSRLKRMIGLDLRALALLRIALGLLLSIDLLIVRGPDHLAFFCDDGIYPRELREKWPHSDFFSIYLLSGSALWVSLIYALTCLSLLSMMVGYKTRWATALAWYLWASTIVRTSLICDGGDQVARLMLFWSIFLPTGARYSVDARRSPQWDELPDELSSLACYGYLQQFALIYFMAAILKTDAMWREQGNALFYVLSRGEIATPLGRLATAFPDALHCMTYLVPVLEFSLPVLILSPWATRRCRLLAVLAVWGFHLGISLFMRIGLFPEISMAASLGMLPAGAMEWLSRKFAAVGRIGSRLLDQMDLWLPGGAQNQAEPPAYRLSPPIRAFLLLILIYVPWVSNLYRFSESPQQPPLLKWFGTVTQQNQSWALFAPRPVVLDGWIIIEATCQNGKKIDLFRGGVAAPDSYAQPELIGARIPNQRWRRYLEYAVFGEIPPLPLAFLRWEATKWNAHHDGDEQVVSLRLICLIQGGPDGTDRNQVQSQIIQYQVGQPIDYNPPLKKGQFVLP